MSQPATPTQIRPPTPQERRQAANLRICRFANSHREHFSSLDVKNGQGLIVLYSIHVLAGCAREGYGWRQRKSFTPYEIADFIRENELWFKLSIKEENGAFTVGSGSLAPYVNEIDGVKQQTMYARDEEMRSGRSLISNFIMKKIKSNVISPTRAHNLIRRLVDTEGQEAYSVHFPRYLPPSNLSTEKASKLNRILRSEVRVGDDEFFECW